MSDLDGLDGLDALAQPACPECGTALRDIRRGYRCPACALVFLPDLTRRAADEVGAQLIRPTSTDTVAPAGS